MLFHNGNYNYIIIILLTAISLLTCSCVYIERKQVRKEKSHLRFDGNIEKSDGKIRTDGVYVDEHYVKYPGWNPWDKFETLNYITCVQFFEDGTFFYLILYGNAIDSIRPQLSGFDIEKIQIRDLGLYSISNDTIHTESYWQNDIMFIKHLFPYYLSVETFILYDDTVIHENLHSPILSGNLVFIPSNIPITPHHPFKSKRWLWSDKKARKQYMKEWKEIKKERKMSSIKYVYCE